MTQTDFSYIFSWYLVIFICTLSILPIIFKLFSKFWDKGYIFAKTLSLIIVTFLSFILSFLKILPYTQTNISLIIISLFLFSLYLQKKSPPNQNIKKILKQKWPIFLLHEILFFTFLFLWSHIRSFRPDIDNLEKPMDWGFINSALRTKYLPPQDMWFAGAKINYYYFGHLVFATLTRLSGIPSFITYNLSMATVLSLCFTSVYSLTSNLIFFKSPKISKLKLLLLPLLSSLLITFGGNLHCIYKITKINIKNNGKLILSVDQIKKASQSYWYPDATRFIGYDPDTDDKTIHEFPLYSFVVADLHGHMNNIPSVILFLAFLFSFFVSTPQQALIDLSLILPSSFLLSILFMTSAWDFANFGLFYAIFTFLVNINRHKSFLYAILKTAINGFLTIAGWFMFTLPFSANFQPMMEGLRWSDARSPFWQLSILYGGFWLICLPFLYLFANKVRQKSKLSLSHIFTISLIITATVLVVLPEIFYIKDIYIHTHRRANTMFKLVYAAFMMYSVSASYIFFSFSTQKNRFIKTVYKIIFLLVFVSHLIYPYFAIKSNYGSLKKYKGLDGLSFIEDHYPDNYNAITWINQNIDGQPVMLEAAGDSYTDYNLISSATGLPTVEGWIVHEWLWRGGYDAPASRQTEVTQIYQSKNVQTLRQNVQKYSIDYIFVGDKEVEKYPDLNEDNIAEISDLVFQSNQTKIYKIRK